MREDYLSSENHSSSKDKEFENILRPKSFSDFLGQDQILKNIKVFVKAAKQRSEPLDHVILHGPPGLGKTTLSHIISNEMSSSLKVTSGPVLEKKILDVSKDNYFKLRASIYTLTSIFVVDIIKKIIDDVDFLNIKKEQESNSSNYRNYIGNKIIENLKIKFLNKEI